MNSHLRATFLIARQTLREAARQRLPGLLVGLTLAFALGARWLREFDFGTAELGFIADCGLGALGLFGAALSIVATAQLFIGEGEGGALLMLLAKPVARGAFVAGRFLGVVALLAVYCLGTAAVIVAAIRWRQYELASPLSAEINVPGVAYSTVVALAYLQWLKLVILAALVLLIATLARGPLFISVAGFFVFLAGQLQPLARARYARGDAWTDRIMDQVLAALPNFQAFSLEQPATEWVSGLDARVLTLSGYGVAYAALACGLAIYGFRCREL